MLCRTRGSRRRCIRVEPGHRLHCIRRGRFGSTVYDVDVSARISFLINASGTVRLPGLPRAASSGPFHMRTRYWPWPQHPFLSPSLFTARVRTTLRYLLEWPGPTAAACGLDLRTSHQAVAGSRSCSPPPTRTYTCTPTRTHSRSTAPGSAETTATNKAGHLAVNPDPPGAWTSPRSRNAPIPGPTAARARGVPRSIRPRI